MCCSCFSPLVKFMVNIKTPHHVADRQYIFCRTGDHDSCCLLKMRLRSLWITMQGICLYVGWYVDLKTLILALTAICMPLCFYTVLCIFKAFFLPLNTLPLPHFFKMPWPIPLHTKYMFQGFALSAASAFNWPDILYINIRVYRLSVCCWRSLRSAACFPTSCSPCCSSTFLFYSCLI